MFLILASMSVLNLLTKYTTTPTINFKLFPWPPLLHYHPYVQKLLLCFSLHRKCQAGNMRKAWILTKC